MAAIVLQTALFSPSARRPPRRGGAALRRRGQAVPAGRPSPFSTGSCPRRPPRPPQRRLPAPASGPGAAARTAPRVAGRAGEALRLQIRRGEDGCGKAPDPCSQILSFKSRLLLHFVRSEGSTGRGRLSSTSWQPSSRTLRT